VRFDGLPVGNLGFTATLYAQADGGGEPVGEAQGIVSILANDTASKALSADDTSISQLVIAQVVVTPELTVEKGKTLQLTVCAVSATGDVVIVAPDSFTWESSDPAVASVDSTGKVTGVSGGTAQISASFNDGQVDKTVSVQVIDRGVTGRWEGALAGGLSGGAAGAYGMLLTQTGTTVTGSVAQYPLENGRFAAGQLTGSFTSNNGAVLELSLRLSDDGSTLAGNFVWRYQGDTNTGSASLTRLSGVPQNPDLTPPAVNSVSPARDATGVARQNLEIRITWSKPVNGWDATLSGMIGGVYRTICGNDLIDSSQNTYDPDTRTYTMHLKSDILLNAGSAYVLKLDMGDDVDWHDPYGVPAWESTGGAYTINFTTGND
jgi:hypothetical protein